MGQEATVIARVKSVAKRQTRQRRPMVTVTLYDGSGYLDLTFFNQPWLANSYRAGMELAVSGIAQRYGRRLQFANQEVEILRGDEQDLVHTGRITPVHRATEGVSTRTIRELVWRGARADPPDRRSAARTDPRRRVPRVLRRGDPAHPLPGVARRSSPPRASGLKFDELFTLELGVAFRKHRLEAAETGIAHRPSTGTSLDRFTASLPFERTGRADPRDRETSAKRWRDRGR